MKEMNHKEALDFCNNLSWGDVVKNHWASENNPHQIGTFVRRCLRGGADAIEVTDKKGDFWYFTIGAGMKLEKLH